MLTASCVAQVPPQMPRLRPPHLRPSLSKRAPRDLRGDPRVAHRHCHDDRRRRRPRTILQVGRDWLISSSISATVPPRPARLPSASTSKRSASGTKGRPGQTWSGSRTRGPSEAWRRWCRRRRRDSWIQWAGLTPQSSTWNATSFATSCRQTQETDSSGQTGFWNMQALFPAPHPYSRPVIGSHESLAAISLDEARRWAAEHYKPERATLLVTGRLEGRSPRSFFEAVLTNQLCGWSRPQSLSSRIPITLSSPSPPVEPAQLVRHRGAVSRPELFVGWAVPGLLDRQQVGRRRLGRLPCRSAQGLGLEDDDVVSLGCERDPEVLGTIIGCQVGLARGTHPDLTAMHFMKALSRLDSDLPKRMPYLKRGLGLGSGYLRETPWLGARDRAWAAHFAGVFPSVIEAERSSRPSRSRRCTRSPEQTWPRSGPA